MSCFDEVSLFYVPVTVGFVEGAGVGWITTAEKQQQQLGLRIWNIQLKK